MNNDLMLIKDNMSLSELGQVLVKSGFFADANDASKAIVKVLAGREMGFGPIASMTGIHIIKGKPAPSANLMAAAVKRNERYDYHLISLGDDLCEIEFFENIGGRRVSLGVSKFTAKDAAKATTQNMDKFPRNMLFARAMSNGVKWYCPDVFDGVTVYAPEELGADVDEEGNLIEGKVVTRTPEVVITELGYSPEPAPTTMSLETAENMTSSKNERYGDLDSEKLAYMATAISGKLAKNGMTQQETDTARMKLDAIKIILAARAQQPA